MPLLLLTDMVVVRRSSKWGGADYAASKAVDGEYTGGMAITLPQQSPWIQIDLQKNYCIAAVQIWDRTNGVCEYPFSQYLFNHCQHHVQNSFASTFAKEIFFHSYS